MITCFDVIKSLLRTEKGTDLEKQRKYQFYVAKNATKIGIKGAVEEIYKVKVAAVHTMIAANSRTIAWITSFGRRGMRPRIR